MKHFQARRPQPADSANYEAWLRAASNINLVDWQVYSYPCINTIVVEGDDGKPALMTSYHPVIVIEALAPKPGISKRDEARSLLELYKSLRMLADLHGIKEIWFQCSDPSLEQFILRKGFVKASAPLFKMKLHTAADPLDHPKKRR